MPSRRALLLMGLAAGTGGLVAGAGLTVTAYPFVFPPPAADDASPLSTQASHGVGEQAAMPAAKLAKTFTFDQRARGRDLIHWANGGGALIATEPNWLLRLGADFKAGPGPNYWVYLNTRFVQDEAEFNADGQRYKLAPLRAFEGAQNYSLPRSLDLTRFDTITIWCETFGAYIGSGRLVVASAST